MQNAAKDALRGFQRAVEEGDAEGIRKGWALCRASNGFLKEGRLCLPHISPDFVHGLQTEGLWQPSSSSSSSGTVGIEPEILRPAGTPQEQLQLLLMGGASAPKASAYPKRSYARPIEYLFARFVCAPRFAYFRAIGEVLEQDRVDGGPSARLFLLNLLMACGERALNYHNPSILPKVLLSELNPHAVVQLLAWIHTTALCGETRWAIAPGVKKPFWVRCFLAGHFQTHGVIMQWIVARRMTRACAVHAIHEKLRLAMRRSMAEYRPTPSAADELRWMAGRFAPLLRVCIDERLMGRQQPRPLPSMLPTQQQVRYGLLHECLLWYSYYERADAPKMLRALLEEGGADPWIVDSLGRTPMELLDGLRCEDVMDHFRQPVKNRYEQRRHEAAERALFERLMAAHRGILAEFAARRGSPGDRMLAVCMAQHPRLGAQSPLGRLSADVLRVLVLERAWPHVRADGLI